MFRLSLCVALLAAVASGQNTDRPDIDVNAHRDRAILRLDFASNYRTEPVACDHLPTESELVRGTMKLVSVPTTDFLTTRAFAVRDVNWLLTPPDAGRVTDDVLITGEGIYRLTNSIDQLPVLGHQLVLHLRIGDELVTFDSGLVPRGSNASTIDIEVHEVTEPDPCERRHFRVAASRVGTDEIHRYVAGDAAAFYFQASPLGPIVSVPLGGFFGLINLPIEPNTPGPGGLSEWALVNFRWHGGGASVDDPFVSILGSACYQHFTGTFTGVPIERMQAEFAVRAPWVDPALRQSRFDSGLVNGSPWPGGNMLPFFHILVEDTNPAYPLMQVDVVAGPVLGP